MRLYNTRYYTVKCKSLRQNYDGRFEVEFEGFPGFGADPKDGEKATITLEGSKDRNNIGIGDEVTVSVTEIA